MKVSKLHYIAYDLPSDRVELLDALQHKNRDNIEVAAKAAGFSAQLTDGGAEIYNGEDLLLTLVD